MDDSVVLAFVVEAYLMSTYIKHIAIELGEDMTFLWGAQLKTNTVHVLGINILQ